MGKIKGIVLDSETADGITVASLKDYKKLLKEQLKDHKNGGWLHPDDVVHNQKMIVALDFVIKDFGG